MWGKSIMAFRAYWFVCAVLLYTVTFLQVREAEGMALVKGNSTILARVTEPMPARNTTPPTTQPSKQEHPCWKVVAEENARFGDNPPQDLSSPSCDKDGYFQPLQCPPLTGCYCVDKYGNPTSRPFRGSFIPDCRKLIRGTKALPTRSSKPPATTTTQVQPTTTEPPCWKRVKGIKARFGDRRPQDLVNPNCDKDGYFQPLQCPPLVGCYCVDKYGMRTSRFFRGSSLPDCRKLIRGTKALPTRSSKPPATTTTQVQPTTTEPPCWKRVKGIKARFGDRRPQDLVNPNCDKDGYFQPLQCPPLVGCYCVDKYGMRTSRFFRGSSLPDCRKLIRGTKALPTRSSKPPATTTTQVQPTTTEPPCWKRVKGIKARFGDRRPQDLVNPNCDKDGYFQPLQCPPLVGCYCVDKYGMRTTRFFRGSSLPDCRKLIRGTKALPTRSSKPPPTTTQVQPTTTEPPCWKRVKGIKARFGDRRPQDVVNPNCDKDGYFMPLQCPPLVGCYCVDKYGKRTSRFFRESSLPELNCLIWGTKPLPTRGSPTSQATTKRTTQIITPGTSTVQVQATKPLPTRNSTPSSTQRTTQRTTRPTKPEPPCWKEVKALKAWFGNRRRPQDLLSPSCDKYGYFKLRRCDPLRGCYCVDKYSGKRTSWFFRGSALPDCRKLGLNVLTLGTKPLPTRGSPISQATTKRTTQIITPEPPCWKEVKALKAWFGNRRRPQDLLSPSCDKDGYFKLRRCDPLRGCYCVDRYSGKRTSRFFRDSRRPNCRKLGLTVVGGL